MSIDYGNLCSVIVKQCFGEPVQLVVDCLFSTKARTLRAIVDATHLTRREVGTALAILIKFGLVSFAAAAIEVQPNIIEYALKAEDVLNVLRYARYAHLIQAKYGVVGSAIIDEFLRGGTQTASEVVLKCINSASNQERPEAYRDTLLAMIQAKYLLKLPPPRPSAEPDFESGTAFHPFAPPEIDLRQIVEIQTGVLNIERANDAGILWHMNFQRFHQDFRDTLMIEAIERKLGATAAECFKYILQLMYERTIDCWMVRVSNPFTFVELKQVIEKKTSNLELVKYLEQYMTLLADDSLGLIRRIDNMGGGQYIVDLGCAFEQLALACVENVITERFGSKASRIFRVIRIKKHVEQEDIQREAMVPAKEAKLLSYNLFQEQFIKIKTIRKTGGGGSGPARSFYLFHLQEQQVVRMLLDICYKALYNSMIRANYEKTENRRLIEKSQKLDGIVATMKERSDAEENIAEIMETLTPPEREILAKVSARITALSKAELTIDETIFLLQMYLKHATIIN